MTGTIALLPLLHQGKFDAFGSQHCLDMSERQISYFLRIVTRKHYYSVERINVLIDGSRDWPYGDYFKQLLQIWEGMCEIRKEQVNQSVPM